MGGGGRRILRSSEPASLGYTLVKKRGPVSDKVEGRWGPAPSHVHTDAGMNECVHSHTCMCTYITHTHTTHTTYIHNTQNIHTPRHNTHIHYTHTHTTHTYAHTTYTHTLHTNIHHTYNTYIYNSHIFTHTHTYYTYTSHTCHTTHKMNSRTFLICKHLYSIYSDLYNSFQTPMNWPLGCVCVCVCVCNSQCKKHINDTHIYFTFLTNFLCLLHLFGENSSTGLRPWHTQRSEDNFQSWCFPSYLGL
jgi:hypothetical protein